jgi:3'-phosphoadenosine 5'-phosphosulfate sulfotransferase (PAPS reductase)/FAD synthetase
MTSIARKADASSPFPTLPNGLSVDDLNSYDKIIVAFSGGKDSVAAFLHLLELGIAKDKIELWHHDVDGNEGSDLMDWPCTRDYCKKFAEAFDVPIYFSWKVGGFEGEMMRENSLTQPTRWENPDGTIGQAGGTRGKEATRLMFPQVSPDLSVRWCSAYLKIDVCTTALNNQMRFRGIRTLLITGERAEESASRAKYKITEPHKSDLRDGKRYQRHVDQWRSVHAWTEQEVWAIIERYNVNPHPCYRVGFSRCSCMPCIFGNKDQWATVRKLDAPRFEKLADLEEGFGKTIKRKVSLRVVVEEGTPYKMGKKDAKQAMKRAFDEPIILKPGKWKLPSGAFGESCGPV